MNIFIQDQKEIQKGLGILKIGNVRTWNPLE